MTTSEFVWDEVEATQKLSPVEGGLELESIMELSFELRSLRLVIAASFSNFKAEISDTCLSFRFW